MSWKHKSDSVTYRPDYAAYDVARVETHTNEDGIESDYITAGITVVDRQALVDFCDKMLAIWDAEFGE